MKTTKEVSSLIKKYFDGNISMEETKELIAWSKLKPANKTFLKELLFKNNILTEVEDYIQFKEQLGDNWKADFNSNLNQKIFSQKEKKTKLFKLSWLAYAACLLLTFFTCHYLININNPSITEVTDLSDVFPGTNKAELILSDGRRIELRTDKDGLAMDNTLKYNDGTSILSLADEQLIGLTASIVVPRGGKYQVTLSDGTKVWLNSLSKLIHPLVFTDDKREVSLEGEAYFEVAKLKKNGKQSTFTVNTRNQSILVTGTEFNVSAYLEDNTTITTLVNGSVNILADKQAISLTPSQQASTNGKGISKKNVDVASYIAWKDNLFQFDETGIKEVMKVISRWYDIDVSFQGPANDSYLYGEIGRDKSLVEVLNLLKKSGVKFKIQQEGKRKKLIVEP